ncbi:MAG: hypothetical protein ACT4OF_11210 [Caulobacteraceae bacterium]
MLRNVIGLAAGVAVGAGLYWYGGKRYQQYAIAPSQANATRPDEYAAFLASDPVAALGGAPLVWSLIALLGGSVAVLIARRFCSHAVGAKRLNS